MARSSPKKSLLRAGVAGVVVVEENINFHVAALRKALGADRNLIRTEVGRGYRFVGVLGMHYATAAPECPGRDEPRSAPTLVSPAIAGLSPRRGGFWSGPYRCALVPKCQFGRVH